MLSAEGRGMTLHILSAVAEAEAKMISARTKAALAEANKRREAEGRLRWAAPGRERRSERAVAAKGTVALQAKADGRAADLAPMIRAWQAAGITSQAGLARALDAAGIPTARGGKWSNVQVAGLLRRLEAA
jgi:DNA invertase Pin-like site-specific DNA recombinase